MNTLHQIATRLEERSAEMVGSGAEELAALLKEGDLLRQQLDTLREALEQDLRRIGHQARITDALTEPAITAAIIDCAG